MRYLLIFLIFITGSCGQGSSPSASQPSGNIIKAKDGGQEYDIQIFDSNFTHWMTTNSRPVNYYPLSYYENQNARYVRSWNSKVMNSSTGGFNSPFGQRIEYDPGTSYGLDLNYKLFWYFKYVEERYGRQYDFP